MQIGIHREAIPGRPPSGTTTTTFDELLLELHGIEFADYSSERGLLAKASLDLDGPLSWHPALRVVFVTGDEVRPL